MSSITNVLEWRYATKKFDDAKTVSEADVQVLKEAVNLTATSFGLQPFRVVVVTDPAVKEKLREAAYGQAQLTTASHVFVFAAMTNLTPGYVDGFIKMLAETRGIPLDSVQGYAEYIKGSLEGKSPEYLQAWNTRQAYVALGTLLAAAAELEVDACPMEGFDNAKVDEILGLSAKGLTSVVIAPVGYRSEEDQTQHYAKVRLPLEEMFI